jgi:hypothetical protein
MNEKCTDKTTKGESTSQYKRKYYMDTGLLKHGFHETAPEN